MSPSRCDEKMTLMPKLPRRRMISSICSRPAGSSPDAGSSRRTSSGPWTIAWASLTRCAMPVEKSPEKSETFLFQPNQEQGLGGPAPGIGGRQPGHLGGIGDEVRRGLVLGQAVVLRHVAHPGPHRQWVGDGVMHRGP